MGCVFCNLNKNKIIGETEGTYTLLSNPYLVDGHCLVIPKKHVEKLNELGGREREELFMQVIKTQEKLLEKFGGCDIRINYRPFQKEDNFKVNHLHIHLQPREFEDELYKKCQIFEKETFKELTEEKLNEFKEMLK